MTPLAELGRASRTARCWVAETLPDAGPCDGDLVRAHLIPKQRIRRELLAAHARAGGERFKTHAAQRAWLTPILWDERCWRWVCGGDVGLSGHHGRIDGRQLTIPRALIPVETEDFAIEHDLVWSLTHDYGQREGHAWTRRELAT